MVITVYQGCIYMDEGCVALHGESLHVLFQITDQHYYIGTLLKPLFVLKFLALAI